MFDLPHWVTLLPYNDKLFKRNYITVSLSSSECVLLHCIEGILQILITVAKNPQPYFIATRGIR